jgi:ABC-2 type transport system permease protein
MTTALVHSGHMTVRHIRAFVRQPWWVAISLIQPIIWLLIFGQLFKRIVEIPGFTSTNYLTFLTPGVVVMSALFSGGWAGMGVITDLDRGVMDRFLVTPVRRSALITGRTMQQSLIVVIQGLIMVGIGLVAGARFDGGILGVVVLLGASILLAAGMGSLSNALALLLRKEESVIAAVQFVVLPMTFLSAGFMQQDLAPQWIQDVSKFNPVNWAVTSGREALADNADWGLVGAQVGYLAAFAVVAGWLALRAFRMYQRSV